MQAETQADTYMSRDRRKISASGGSAHLEIFSVGLAAVAVMGLLSYGYITRTYNTEAAGGGQMPIQAQTPTKQDMVSPMDRNEPPTSSSTGQGASNGERVAPR